MKKQAVISNRFYFLVLILTAAYILLYNTLLLIGLANLTALIPIGITCLMCIICVKRYTILRYAIIYWTLYFLVKHSIKLISLSLAYGYNGFSDIPGTEVLEPMAWLVWMIVIWIGANKYVEVHEEKTI